MCDDWTGFEYVSLGSIPKIAGVYFLMNDCELVYIGQSNNIKRRIGTHHNNWNCTLFLGDEPLEENTFDGIYFFECDYKPERKEYETMFKEDYSPKLNNFDWTKKELEFLKNLVIR